MNSIKLDQAVSQQIFHILSKASLEGLKEGIVLQGKIQSLENGLLFIKLLDGASLTAQVPEGFSAQPGEPITLEIGARKNDQLTARIINSEPGAVIVKETPAFENRIAQNLSSMGVPSSEKLVADVLKLIKAEPMLPEDQASFLAANGMDTQPEMMQVLNKISEQEFHLHNNLDVLKEGLVQGLKEAGAKPQILKPLVTSLKAEELSVYLDKLISGHTPEQKETLLNSLRQLLDKNLLEALSKSRETPPPPDTATIAQEIIKGGLSFEKAQDFLESQESFKNALRDILKPDLADNLLETIQKSLNELHTQTDRLERADAPEIQKILDKFFDRALIKAENGKIEDADLNSKTKALKEIMEFSHKALHQLGAAAQDRAMPALKEIDQAFRFFNQVVTYDSMVQLPLKINSRRTTGELYVMKRKNGRKKIDGENFTLFLSLRTEGLGRIESFLNASRKIITISFRVEHEGLTRLVKDNHRTLYDNLLKKGYKLADLRCRVLEEDEAGPLNAAQKTQEALGLAAKMDLKI